jgi:hypothetical protein
MSLIFVVYITFYRGNKMPPFYIGYSTEGRVKRGYNGSVNSQKYKAIWRQERRDNPHLFKTVILQRFEIEQDAKDRERLIHLFFHVSNNSMFINQAIANNGFQRSTKSQFKKGHPVPEELRQKLRDLKTGTKASIETRLKQSLAGLARGPRSEETKQRISESNMGHSVSEGTLQKMRRPFTEEHKRNLRKPRSAEAKKNMRDSWETKRPNQKKGWHHSEEVKQKIRQSNLGKHHG